MFHIDDVVFVVAVVVDDGDENDADEETDDAVTIAYENDVDDGKMNVIVAVAVAYLHNLNWSFV